MLTNKNPELISLLFVNIRTTLYWVAWHNKLVQNLQQFLPTPKDIIVMPTSPQYKVVLQL